VSPRSAPDPRCRTHAGDRPALLRIGVHIADVSAFVPPFSALDVEAGMRGTSTYLVQRVIPMLPPLLCEELCSLNPGVERFAFSVEWELEEATGKVLSTWAGRSVIRSCAKLSYNMVQAMIDGPFSPEVNAPAVVLHDGHTWADVIGDCMVLQGVAAKLRAARFESGALRLDNTKVCYTLDKDGNPVGSWHYVQREANQLVEEFMLLANLSVAQIISTAFPALAMLRRHVPPDEAKMVELNEVAKEAGIPMDTSSAAALQASLAALRARAAAGDYDRETLEAVTMLATRPMQLATYFCTGDHPEGAVGLFIV
jgi:DIS3-like exonuclease 2